MSHSRGVNSAGAERVVGSTLAYTLWHKAVDAPWGMATRKNLLRWGVFTLPLKSFVSYEGEPFATWCTISYSTSSHQYSIFLFPWSVLAFVQTTSPGISWTMLVNITSFLLCLSLSLLDWHWASVRPLLKLFCTSSTQAGTRLRRVFAHIIGKRSSIRSSGLLPKHEVMGWTPRNRRFRAIVSSHQNLCCVTTWCTLTYIRGWHFLKLPPFPYAA